MRQLFLFLALLGFSIAQDWDASNYPNPTAGGFKQCNMRSASSLCDPDQVLMEQQRYRLNNELNQLEARTRQEHGRNFCEKKGITGAVALAKRVRGTDKQNAVQGMANDMLRKWNLDRQCQKAIVIVLAVDDRKFWVARGARVPVYGQELTNIFAAQKDKFGSGEHAVGLQNVIDGIIDATLAKQGPGEGPAPGGSTGGKGRGQPQPGRTGGGGSGEGFKWPISPWILLGIVVFVVIPILCCCCCLYFCCFRNKDGNRRQGPSDAEGGGPGQPFNSSGQDGGGGRGGGFNFGGILSGLASGAAGNALMNMFRNRGGRGAGGGGGYPPASGRPAPPTYDDQYGDGKRPGLYPSAPKEDQGGGGGF